MSPSLRVGPPLTRSDCRRTSGLRRTPSPLARVRRIRQSLAPSLHGASFASVKPSSAPAVWMMFPSRDSAVAVSANERPASIDTLRLAKSCFDKRAPSFVRELRGRSRRGLTTSYMRSSIAAASCSARGHDRRRPTISSPRSYPA